MARFDITHADQITLHLSGETITARRLQRPLVVLANYVFDSIPQELYYLDEHRCQQCLVSLFVDADPTTLSVAEVLARVHPHYEYRDLTEPPYPEAELQHLLADYQRTLTDTHLLFPAAGLRCLQRLQAWSTQGLLVLSADKGEHRLSALQGKPPPGLARHGSFSLSVNYHAFKTYCESNGGLAWFPTRRHHSINVGCLVLLREPSAYVDTQRAYQRHVQDFGPDDFYSITKHARQTIAEMSVEDILAYVRLSLYDSYQFARYLPRLLELAPELEDTEREALTDVIEHVWTLYYPLGEDLDLANKIACVLYAMDDYARALTYFERSIAIYGQDTGTLANMAVCYHLLGQPDRAAPLLRKVVHYDPANQQAKELLAGYIA